MPTLRYFGHAACEITHGGHTVLIDPFITGNDLAPVQADDLAADFILVTHGHGDHLGDAIPIAKRTGATIVAPFELAHYCAKHGAEVHPMHIGGAHEFPFGRVKLTQALHGSAVTDGEVIYTGNPCGFVVTMGGKALYHAGDTGLFGDMALIGRLDALAVALLPIGDNFTMGAADAVEAAKLLRPAIVVPMHYDTFPVIQADVAAFRARVEAETSATCRILKPGETLDC